MAETDLSTWFTVEETAVRIGCSTRTVERLGKARKLEGRLRRQDGTPPVAVYNPDDVARIAAERRPAPAPFVLPHIPDSSNGNGHREAPSALSHNRAIGSADDPISLFCAAMIRVLQSPPSPPVAESVAERRRPQVEDLPSYVPLDLAMAFSGLSERYLRKMIKLGTVTAIRDGRQWKIHKKDVVALG